MDIVIENTNSKIIIIDDEVDLNTSTIDINKKSEWVDKVEYTEPTQYEKDLIKHTKKPEELIELEKIEVPIVIDERKMFIEMAKVVALVQHGHRVLDNPSNMKQKEKQKIIDSMAFFVDNLSIDAMKEKFNDVCNNNLFTPKADYSDMTINPFIN